MRICFKCAGEVGAIRVADLIEKLQKLDPELLVAPNTMNDSLDIYKATGKRVPHGPYCEFLCEILLT
jgi:hypothetical protein